MALVKRGKTWHTHFFVDGVRYRQSLETSDWREAQAKEKQLVAEIASGRLLPSHREYARWPFDKAVEHYLESRRLHLADRSLAKERELLNHPKRYFKSLPLVRLTPENLRTYLAKRKADGLSNATLNMVSGALRRLLKMAKRWQLFADEIRRLPEQSHVGRALTESELAGLLKRAESRPEWGMLRCAMTLAVNTTMRSAELKHLSWRDVDFFERTITIRSSKTEAGQRVIPMNEDAVAAVLYLRKQAQLAGADAPDHFVFPACESGRFNPSIPMKSWRTAWRTLTRSIQCPACGQLEPPGATCRNKACKANIEGLRSATGGLRFHDLRHTAVTMLAESNASEQTVMAIAGHVSRKMLEHYSHIRMDAKRRAVSALAARRVLAPNTHLLGDISKGYDTKHDTNMSSSTIKESQAIVSDPRHR